MRLIVRLSCLLIGLWWSRGGIDNVSVIAAASGSATMNVSVKCAERRRGGCFEVMAGVGLWESRRV